MAPQLSIIREVLTGKGNAAMASVSSPLLDTITRCFLCSVREAVEDMDVPDSRLRAFSRKTDLPKEGKFWWERHGRKKKGEEKSSVCCWVTQVPW